MVIDAAHIHELVELLALNFKPNEINAIGTNFSRDFDLHRVSGTRSVQSLNARRAAVILVEYLENQNQTLKLIEFLVQIDGGSFMGNPLEIKGIEVYLEKLAQCGLVYNARKRKIVPVKSSIEDSPDWGVLRPGKAYQMTIVSIDISRNSELVKKYGAKQMQKLYAYLWVHIKTKMREYNGRIWAWAGDGGLAAFTFRNHIWDALKFSIEIQATLPLFCAEEHYPIEEPIALRFGLDTGKITFQANTGNIISEVINYACHLEKRISEPGKVAVSENIFKKLNGKATGCFKRHSTFEGTGCYLSVKKMDELIY